MKTSARFALPILLGALAMGAPAVSAAKDVAPDKAAVLKALLDCKTRTNPTERLACYDSAATQFETATAKGDVVVVDREQIRTIKRQSFGLSLPSFAIFNGGSKTEEIDTRIELVLDYPQAGEDGHLQFVFEDGAVWRQFDAGDIYPKPRKGMKAVITRGAVGGFFMSLNGKPGIKVQRLR
ncbi:MAG: hypothetical protein CFE28_14095 [Alphaproteobacteria bacterium PA2]|nr:MAG: hypothetical protein CFE28_14095 [Alphaproteobacteria bacterium PA2]